MTGITRRGFLKSGGAAIGLSLAQLNVNWVLAAGKKPQAPILEYADFEEVYRKKWAWDKVVKGTHQVNCWFQRVCSWNVYVKDGIVWREEQTATYAPLDPRIPDLNPRGCQKGGCFSQRMYDEARLRYPLKRVGERGEGKWKRISWDEALKDIADGMIDALVSEAGASSLILDMGTNGEQFQTIRLATLLDIPVIDTNPEIGDARPGTAVTFGTEEVCGSMEDVFHSDLIFIWGGNPLYTQIPNAHFITEARYNGTKIITIAPDFSASAVHTDQWVPVKIGTDAALGLSIAHVMIEEGTYKKRFVQEQTDLPLLRRVDNGRFLREADIKAGGSDSVFYFYDLKSKQVLAASDRTLELGDMDPALEGVFEVETLTGKVETRPVFASLREHLRQYRPELASAICGVDPETIRGLAHDLANARAASFLSQSNFSKYYHGLEMERAQILCCVLAGQIGHKGAGYQGFPIILADGEEIVGSLFGKEGVQKAVESLQAKMGPAVAGLMAKGLTYEMALHQFARHAFSRGDQISTVMWLYHQQAGLDQIYGQSQLDDPHMKRPLSSYMEEAVAKGWQTAKAAPTKVWINTGGNLLRRLRGHDKVQKQLLPKVDLMVTVDFRMSNTAMQSDYVLPAAGWYEHDGFADGNILQPFVTATTAAVRPVGESKSDFETYTLLAKTIQRRAAERGLKEFKDREGKARPFDVYDQMTFGGEITEKDKEAMLELILRLSSNVGGITWKQLKKQGHQRHTGLGTNYVSVGNSTDVKPNQTITACTHHTEKKVPWPTLTRRLQFCIDQPFYEELGEVLPVHKDLPRFGGNHPIQLTGGHTRWSIHSSWQGHKHLMRLQRGEPVVFVSAADAKARGIKDGDKVRVFNDNGDVQFSACVAAAVRPGQAVVYHAWEAQQFKGKPYDSLFHSPINPVQLAGGYGHIQPRFYVFSPGMHDRGTYVDLARVEA